MVKEIYMVRLMVGKMMVVGRGRRVCALLTYAAAVMMMVMIPGSFVCHAGGSKNNMGPRRVSAVPGHIGRHELEQSYYAATCPRLPHIVSKVVTAAVTQDPRMAASLLRLHFHDCFVHGCDASILLEGPNSELLASANNNSIRGMDVINQIKRRVLLECGNTVSCADIISLAAREGVAYANGPWWPIALGRRDSTQSYPKLVDIAIPSPVDSLDTIFNKFANVGLYELKHVVALSGAHTFGRARCLSFNDRLYNWSGTGYPDPRLNGRYQERLQLLCPKGGYEEEPVNLDATTGDAFDNAYYTNLKMGLGLLQSDQQLYFSANLSDYDYNLQVSNNGGDSNNRHGGDSSHSNNDQALLFRDARALVHLYATSQQAFFDDFADSMIKMSAIAPPADNDSSPYEIRFHCSSANIS